MKKATPNEDLRFLCLDGGGVQGLSTLLILQHLMEEINRENPPKPCEVFDMIGGTGTAGAIAIMLGRLEMSVESCIDLYTSFSSFTGKIPVNFDPEKSKVAIQRILVNHGLREDELLNDGQERGCKVLLYPMGKQNGDSQTFTSYQLHKASAPPEKIEIWRAAQATCATSSFSARFPINGIDNTSDDDPTDARELVSQLWADASQLWSEPLEPHIRCLVSIGVGERASTIIRRSKKPSERLFSAHDDHMLKANAYQFDRLGDILPRRYFGFDTNARPECAEHKVTEDLNNIVSSTRIYMENGDVTRKFENCATNLSEKPSDKIPDPTSEESNKESSACAPDPPIRYIRRKTFPSMDDKPSGNTHLLKTWVFSMILVFIVFVLIRPSLAVFNNTTNIPDFDHSIPIFAVMGRTGAGKSSFIDVLGGRHYKSGLAPKTCNGLESCSQELEFYKASVHGRTVYLMDTPGFGDSKRTEIDVLTEISHKLASPQITSLLGGVIYLHDISMVRFDSLGKRNLEMFEYICGKGAFQNVALVTNKWLANPSLEEDERQKIREQELINIYWKNMTDEGSRIYEHDNTVSSAELIVSSLRDKPRVKLLIRHEMSEENRPLKDTSAGRAADGTFEHHGSGWWFSLSGLRVGWVH